MAVDRVMMALTVLDSLVVDLTLVSLIVRVCHLPRQLWLQPGMAACLAQVAGWGLVASRLVYPWVSGLVVSLASDAAIPMAWAALALTGR